MVAAMNFIIANKEKAYLSSSFSEDPDYFTMFKKETDGGLIICSEKYPDENNWISIENNSIEVY